MIKSLWKFFTNLQSWNIFLFFSQTFDQIVDFESASFCELLIGSKLEDESNFKGMIQDIRLNNIHLIINESNFDEGEFKS